MDEDYTAPSTLVVARQAVAYLQAMGLVPEGSVEPDMGMARVRRHYQRDRDARVWVLTYAPDGSSVEPDLVQVCHFIARGRRPTALLFYHRPDTAPPGAELPLSRYEKHAFSLPARGRKPGPVPLSALHLDWDDEDADAA